MDINRSLSNLAWLLFFSLFLSQSIAAKGITLEEIPWPAESECESCVTIQFMTMEMRLPLNLIGRLHVINYGTNLHILPPSYPSQNGVLFLAIPPENLLKLFESNGLLDGLNVNTNEEFFDALGTPPNKSEPLAALRQMKDLDIANQYTKTSKNSVHAYRIQSVQPNNDTIYVVIDDEEIVYMIAGEITEELYEAVLSNLRIKPWSSY
jgi:hypothetical protein